MTKFPPLLIGTGADTMVGPDILKATNLGAAAYSDGRRCVPACDPAFLSMLEGRRVGDPRTKAETKAWIAGWTRANLAATPRVIL